MAPQILHRVIHGRPDPEPWQKAHLTFQPAILHGYRRYRVRGADYPGIIPVSSSAQTKEQWQEREREREQTQQPTREPSVLGALVSGLTDGDIHRLDIFEGTEYQRHPIKVRTLQESLSSVDSSDAHHFQKEKNGQGAADGHLRDVLDAAGAEFADEGEEDVEAVTYVYVAGEKRLEDVEWDFESFKKDKMAWWVGADESEW